MEEVRLGGSTLPPSYDEVIRQNIEPPPVYTERDETRPTEPQISRAVSNGERSRVRNNAWIEDRVVVTQPTGEVNRQISASRVAVEQPSNREKSKSYSCNCFCAACKWKRCSTSGECFCYNCILFALYALTCGPGVLCCVFSKKICPETFADCPTRDTFMFDSYRFRNENLSSRCLWACCGTLCCFSCDEHVDVCSLAIPCEERFGMRCIKKMTCYCEGSACSHCTFNLLDEHACGFIWDFRQCGFKSH